MVLMLSPMFTQAHYDERHPKNFQKEQVFHRSDFFRLPDRSSPLRFASLYADAPRIHLRQRLKLIRPGVLLIRC